MPLFNLIEATFIGTVLEGVFYGLYCIIFILYIRIHTSKPCADRNLLIYPISSLFVLCSAYFALDFSQQYFTMTQRRRSQLTVWNLNLATSTLYSLIDVVAQGVLIYRCWVVWNKKRAVIIIPSILALVSLATSLTLLGELAVLGLQNAANRPGWFTPIGTLSFSLSLAVNAILSGLLVFKIAKTSLALGDSRGEGMTDFKPLISMLVESGLMFFMAQLVWVICFTVESVGFYLITGPITMIYGIVPTTVVVRVAMGNTRASQPPDVESHIKFAFVDENSAAKRISARNPRFIGTEGRGTVEQ